VCISTGSEPGSVNDVVDTVMNFRFLIKSGECLVRISGWGFKNGSATGTMTAELVGPWILMYYKIGLLLECSKVFAFFVSY
jgi:hypothetical protein